ncbi:MAG: winged helix-turn-helix domain-containing protein [Candidatus Bathyarchaeota archaeon]|jgi:predicted transcriptional regulator
MARYRDRLQIVADILVITSRRVKKTRIMYQANLSYKLLCKYLDEVIAAGLVSCEKGDCYILTVKGKEFLKRHEEYSKQCEIFEEHFNHVNNERDALEKMSSTVKVLDKQK